MDDPQAAVEGSRLQSRVAAVSFPSLPGTRLTLPGVMDDEGRVDESRLRMHIFKNGRKASAHAHLHTCWSKRLESGQIKYVLHCKAFRYFIYSLTKRGGGGALNV